MKNPESRIGDQKVYRALESLGIAYQYYSHPPAATIQEAMRWWASIPSRHCKNLFLRNHKGNRHYLVIVEGHRNVDIGLLERLLRQGKLSFASPHRLQRYLGVTPGSVSPFGLLNDREKHVHVFVDESLREAERLSFHPNDNQASLVLRGDDFFRYLAQTGNSWEFLQLAEGNSASSTN